MKRSFLLLILVPILLGACSPKVATKLNTMYPPLGSKEDIKVFDINDPVPRRTEVVGTVRIKNSAFSKDCSWEIVIEQAKAEARKAGGNALKIMEHRQPGTGSICHQITANILKLGSVTEPIAEKDTYYSPYPAQNQPGLNEEYETGPPKVRLGVYGGWSARLAKISDDLPADFHPYMKELMKGYHLGLDGTYFLNEQLGLGLKYNMYKASNSIEIQSTTGSSVQYGEMSDNITIHYFGPTLSTRLLNSYSNNALLLGVSLGYMSYNDDSQVMLEKYKISSNTVGISLDLGYDVSLSKNTVLGFQLSLMAGALSKLEVVNGTNVQKITLSDNNMESLTRIDLSVGLRLLQ